MIPTWSQILAPTMIYVVETDKRVYKTFFVGFQFGESRHCLTGHVNVHRHARSKIYSLEYYIFLELPS